MPNTEFHVPGTDAKSMVELMSALFDSVDDGIIVGDTEGRILFGNGAALRINDNYAFPVDPEERVLHYVEASDGNFEMKVSALPLRRAIVEGEVRGLEVTLLTPKGQKKNLICNGRALYNTEGEKIGAVLTVHDRTQERAAQQQAFRIERENAKLLRINTELEKFSAIAAHDLKSPLNSITQFVELLRESLGDRIKPDEAQMLAFIFNAGARLRLLIDDLLAFARAGNDLGQMTSVDLASVVEDALSALSPDLKSTNAFVKVGLMPVIIADRVGISQVFQNLISNAIKYRSEKQLAIEIEAFDDGEEWRISIKDNGIGIDDQDRLMAFELFKRFEVSSKREGTGLGLPICKRVVEAHGGSIRLESAKGMGTTFIFTLPKAQSTGLYEAGSSAESGIK